MVENEIEKYFKKTKECGTQKILRLECVSEFRNDGIITLTSNGVAPPFNNHIFFCGAYNELKTILDSIFKIENHCEWCGDVIGSKEYKKFVNVRDPEDKMYLDLDCYNEMKNKGIIG